MSSEERAKTLISGSCKEGIEEEGFGVEMC